MFDNAIFSECGDYRYTLERYIGAGDKIVVYVGANPSMAGIHKNDQTSTKWIHFARLLKALKYYGINPFAYRATDISELGKVSDPIGPENDRYIREMLDLADIVVPCWGNVTKVPRALRYRFDEVHELLVASGKPLLCFGLTKSGCPMHPLMLGYDTKLVPYLVD